MQYIVCSDLESVLTPEIWIRIAEKISIEELKITTKDEPDYDKLMKRRISILNEYNLNLRDIREIISTIDPLPGAKDFLNWLRLRTQVIILSDTFTEFAGPLMEKLNYPTILCNSLVINDDDKIIDYKIRQDDGKRKVIKALKGLNYKVIAFGDSYNDINMLKEADIGILYCPPENIKNEFADIPAVDNYKELKSYIEKYLNIPLKQSDDNIV